jgi:ubiquinone/menaquinone biosynthesis C-methylase UbiE
VNAGPPLETLLRLPERGAGGLDETLRLAARGDWRTRALALSAAGRISRADPFARSVHPFRHWIARRVPFLRERFPSAGYQGKYVRHQIANALVDRSWMVRTAAALALGECRAPSMAGALRPLLEAPYRAERIAAAAALVACGEQVAARSSLLDGAFAAPAHIGDTTRTIDFLTALAACHLDVLDHWLTIEGQEPPDGGTPAAWAALLAGPVPQERSESSQAEIERYDASGETEYLLVKPFSWINRTQNARLLHSFLVVAEQLRVPLGGRVLDLGAGSGWVSELLAKLGYRPITLDLSYALLTLAKRRFARERLTPRLTVADMTLLPIATGSMDAVVVIDALHHVPGMPLVFREAYRVLADGGQFVLAEPGEGHSDSEKSRGEMLEHGVQEREVHLFEAIDYARAAGFGDVRVVPHFVPLAHMTPDDVRDAMAAPADKWVIHKEDRPGLFPQLVLQSILDRPIVVFCKGRRPIDSRMPQTLKAGITPRLVREGARVSGTVAIRNLGDTIWLGRGEKVGYVLLGVQLLTAGHRVLDLNFSRSLLPADLSPDGALELDVKLTLPDADGRYVLKLDLVDEGICWFEDVGSKPVYVEV